MAGYSGTALSAKLGFKPGFRILFDQPPDHWDGLLGILPDGCRIAGPEEDLDLVVLFALDSGGLDSRFHEAAVRLAPAGTIWVAWPKKAAKYPTDLTENVVREIGLAEGLVDVKVCAIDEFWSGLKFVKRLKNR